MNRFAGDFAFYDRLMREIPHFDKSPREIKDDHCYTCDGYNPKTRRCRFCECQYDKPLPKHRK